jgi:hypothetical protein
MSVLKKPQLVKLFFSIFSNNLDLIEEIIKLLEIKYGLIDMSTGYIPFDQTDYYASEFGDRLIRKIIFFEDLISPEKIVEIKLDSINLEEKYSSKGKRRINIDPGYLALSRVILSTGKDYSHRIYLDKGVYADLTYIYKKKQGYISLPWTYPDYAKEEFKKIFIQAREILRLQLRSMKND